MTLYKTVRRSVSVSALTSFIYVSDLPHAALRRCFDREADLELAVLIGSRATGSASEDSDWDIAVQWNRSIPPIDQPGRTETLRRGFAEALGITESKIDLVDIPGCRLTMRAVITEEGIPLKGEDSLAWAHLLGRTWRYLEDHYWDQCYAA